MKKAIRILVGIPLLLITLPIHLIRLTLCGILTAFSMYFAKRNCEKLCMFFLNSTKFIMLEWHSKTIEKLNKK
jgi:hypothetical protein